MSEKQKHPNHGKWKHPARLSMCVSHVRHGTTLELWVGPRRFGFVEFFLPRNQMLVFRHPERLRDYFMRKVSAFMWDAHRGQSLAHRSKGAKAPDSRDFR